MKKILWKRFSKNIYNKGYIYYIILHMKNLNLDTDLGFTPANGGGGTLFLSSEASGW